MRLEPPFILFKENLVGDKLSVTMQAYFHLDLSGLLFLQPGHSFINVNYRNRFVTLTSKQQIKINRNMRDNFLSLKMLNLFFSKM